ncbi:sensor histidine kinase [Halocynthiibacter styelae]|uniref:histidine kinase n=1 Tax=Halocynthiibacter styelae TaxID=2761955 RepID=A0A8J7IDE5_9RHOB|nr:HAMP domain-containing sensor histidine kinase [Paenihalocynthiibacter styelae]MBI1494368.1 HAMP domain-containing histidine kinase [Paenihalocynthiibacter styelae]
MGLNTLSGRFLILTVIFVMLAEIMIFVPSVARFREDYLLLRLERAQIAALAVLANDMIDPEVEAELLDSAGVYNVVLRRNDSSQLVLSSPMPAMVNERFDLRDAPAGILIRDAIKRLFTREPQVITLLGQPVREGGLLIEVTMGTGPLRMAMMDYGLNILILSAVISVITALMLFIAVRGMIVMPIKRVVATMQAYARAPEDARTVIMPDSRVKELNEAETALQSMQTEITGALRQKERLAQLGGAVAKVSHDLRNILTVTQLMADRMEGSADPAVQKAAPKLINSVSRAVNLCESTLAFGKAEEPAPNLEQIPLGPLVEDVIESERLSAGADSLVSISGTIPEDLEIRADAEQLHRVLSNLVRNARQAVAATGQAGSIFITGSEDATEWCLMVRDTGPGLPPKARENLFTAFQGNARKGGTGLGLTISAELIRGHGGHLELSGSDENGTCFAVHLPRNM